MFAKLFDINSRREKQPPCLTLQKVTFPQQRQLQPLLQVARHHLCKDSLKPVPATRRNRLLARSIFRSENLCFIGKVKVFQTPEGL